MGHLICLYQFHLLMIYGMDLKDLRCIWWIIVCNELERARDQMQYFNMATLLTKLLESTEMVTLKKKYLPQIWNYELFWVQIYIVEIDWVICIHDV